MREGREEERTAGVHPGQHVPAYPHAKAYFLLSILPGSFELSQTSRLQRKDRQCSVTGLQWGRLRPPNKLTSVKATPRDNYTV